MTAFEESDLPKVQLSRAQRIRLGVVALLVLVAVFRVVPDLARIWYPLQVFGYATDGDGVVQRVPAKVPSGSDRLERGDRVMISRIKPFDRKPGLARFGFTYDNPSRYLPIMRHGHERIVHLIAHPESATDRVIAVMRIALFMIAMGLGALLYLVKPGIATAAFFVFCLSSEAPATFMDLLLPNPWREIPIWLDDTLRGCGRTALLLFALCLIDGDDDPERERIFAWVAGALGLALGLLQAYAAWRVSFAALPAHGIDGITTVAASTLSTVTVLVFGLAWLRGRGVARLHTTWIALAFGSAALARVISDALFPAYIPLWLNGVLLSMAIVPAIVVWIAVIRDRYFNVDFVVSRAIVYVALTGAAIATITAIEEVGTYVFQSNTNVAYIALIPILLAVGAFTGKIAAFMRHIVDRFIFRDRHQQRQALEFIAGYILDAETEEDVYRALLQDAAHALKLAFGGLLARQPDGSYELAQQYDWPDDCVVRLGPDDPITKAIGRVRGVMTFSGKDSALIREAFPNERLAFAAPIFFDRHVSAIVVYGHNVTGLDLDPEERELLIRVVQHASIVLNEIELAHYRTAVQALSVPLLGNG